MELLEEAYQRLPPDPGFSKLARALAAADTDHRDLRLLDHSDGERGECWLCLTGSLASAGHEPIGVYYLFALIEDPETGKREFHSRGDSERIELTLERYIRLLKEISSEQNPPTQAAIERQLRERLKALPEEKPAKKPEKHQRASRR